MSFNNSILAGDTLVRDSIKSEGYVPGTNGWSINRDGTAEFNDVVIRGSLQSSNFIAGVSGWQLLDSGAAELNEAIVRGIFTVGDTSDAYIDLDVSGSQSTMHLSSGRASEVEIGYISNVDTGILSRLGLASSDDGEGGIFLFMESGTVAQRPNIRIDQFNSSFAFFILEDQVRFQSFNINTASLAGTTHPFQVGLTTADNVIIDKWGIGARNNGAAGILSICPLGGTAEFGVDTLIRILNTTDASLSSTGHAFQIGDTSGANLIIDNNEIIARSNGAVSTLNLQNDGGIVNIGGGITCADMRPDDEAAAANVVTTSTSFATDNTNGPNFTFPYPPSGRVLVIFSADAVNSGAGFSNMSFRIRDTNAAGTIRFTGGSDETARKEGTGRVTIAHAVRATGLPTSGTGFIEGLYLASSGTGTFRNAHIVVIPSV